MNCRIEDALKVRTNLSQLVSTYQNFLFKRILVIFTYVIWTGEEGRCCSRAIRVVSGCKPWATRRGCSTWSRKAEGRKSSCLEGQHKGDGTRLLSELCGYKREGGWLQMGVRQHSFCIVLCFVFLTNAPSELLCFCCIHWLTFSKD